ASVSNRAHAAGEGAQTINASKTWVYDTPTTTLGSDHWQFSIGAGAGVSAKGDCNQISADVNGAIRARAFSVGANAFVAQLTATSDKADSHGVTLSMYACGILITPPGPIASTTDPLSDVFSTSWTLPTADGDDLGLKGSWSGTFHLPGGLGTASYSGTYNL